MKYRYHAHLEAKTPLQIMNCRGKTLDPNARPLVMGILNVTPDSFSDGGKYNNIDAALARALEMVEEGADLIDVGGESTRPGWIYTGPGFTPVTEEEELARVIPVIERLVREVDVPLSVDTYKAEVAKQALEAGAHIINDIWGLKKDARMAEVVARYEAGVIVMHNRTHMDYQDLVTDVVDDLKESIAIAHQAGIEDSRIWLDPGIGFAKNVQHNLLMMNRLGAIVELGYPVVLATSRKSMIWKTLHIPPDQAQAGTAATIALGIAQGCRIIRVHDVEMMRQVAQMTEAILAAGKEEKDGT